MYRKEKDTHTPSTTTATPDGWTALETAAAICLVSRSCTCKRRLNTSTILKRIFYLTKYVQNFLICEILPC